MSACNTRNSKHTATVLGSTVRGRLAAAPPPAQHQRLGGACEEAQRSMCLHLSPARAALHWLPKAGAPSAVRACLATSKGLSSRKGSCRPSTTATSSRMYLPTKWAREVLACTAGGGGGQCMRAADSCWWRAAECGRRSKRRGVAQPPRARSAPRPPPSLPPGAGGPPGRWAAARRPAPPAAACRPAGAAGSACRRGRRARPARGAPRRHRAPPHRSPQQTAACGGTHSWRTRLRQQEYKGEC
jgi:hypothetical protein